MNKFDHSWCKYFDKNSGFCACCSEQEQESSEDQSIIHTIIQSRAHCEMGLGRKMETKNPQYQER